MAGNNDTSPERQAYQDVEEEGYKGRLATNVGNIRRFKDNPYIRDLPEADRIELNRNLLTPYDGELFIDDERFQWVCKYEKDDNGVIQYIYTSKEHDMHDKLKYYESKGVLNQLMSAYNNGQVYKFYFNRATKEMFPNTSIVFPDNYYSYTVRRQNLNENDSFVFVAGIMTDDLLLDTHIGMKTIVDTINGTTYKRMGPAKIFTVTDPDHQIDQVINNEFYVVEFYDANGELVDKKLFQAVESIVTNTQVPSASVVDLKINVFRNSVAERSANNVYPLIAGEDLTRTVSFTVTAIYSDGTEKIITDKLDTDQLTRQGWDVNTSGAEIGKQFPVRFTYNPFIDGNAEPMSSSITREVIFQVVANNYEKLYKVLPVMWMDNSATANNTALTGRVFKLKLYTLSSDGVLENRTRAFWNTLKKVNNNNELVQFTDCRYTYDTLNGYIIFAFPENSITGEVPFSFKLYDDSIETEFRFIVNFGDNYAETKGIFIKVYTTNANSDLYGYDVNSGVFRTLGETYATITSNNNEYMANTALINTVGANGVTIKINSYTGIEFSNRYMRVIDGSQKRPNRVQFYSVKDDSVTPLTEVFQINSSAKVIEVPTFADGGVRDILNDIDSFDYILAKFYYEEGQSLTLVNIDTYCVNKNNTGIGGF